MNYFDFEIRKKKNDVIKVFEAIAFEATSFRLQVLLSTGFRGYRFWATSFKLYFYSLQVLEATGFGLQVSNYIFIV